MSTNIVMPESVAGGTLARWLKQVGDRVGMGEVLAEVENDKATMEIESPGDGVLAQICVVEGSTEVAAGTVLGLISG
jgi:pyruvate/2-oxoglutarate dehydrogenase complex dihydrolipoamide acyltransferase (E2) component